MAEQRVPDPTLMARLQLSVKGVDWAAGLVSPWQHTKVEGGWSPHQHLFHLLATERQVYQPRLDLMLREDGATFVFWDGQDFMRTQYSKEPAIEDLANEFTDERQKTVELLKGASSSDWQRTAIWPDGNEVDLAWFAEKILWHGLDHFATLLAIHGAVEHRQSRRWMQG